MKTTIFYIGRETTIPGWPQVGTLTGLFDALARWTLDPCLDMSGLPCFEPDPLRAPFRGPNKRSAGRRWDQSRNCTVYLSGEPVDPEAPEAVSFVGNFLTYSFGFSVVTDDPVLIAQLDAAIAVNMRRPEYISTAKRLAEQTRPKHYV